MTKVQYKMYDSLYILRYESVTPKGKTLIFNEYYPLVSNLNDTPTETRTKVFKRFNTLEAKGLTVKVISSI